MHSKTTEQQYITNQVSPYNHQGTYGSNINPINQDCRDEQFESVTQSEKTNKRQNLIDELVVKSDDFTARHAAWIDRIHAYRNLIMENIEYPILCERYEHERVDEVVELILETVSSKRQHIRIAGDEFPGEVVKNRFMKLGESEIEYVFDCIDKNTTKVRNIKAYMQTALFNAPATIDSYYRSEVNHDLHNG